MTEENRGDNPPQNNDKNLLSYTPTEILGGLSTAIVVLFGDNIATHLIPSFNISLSVLFWGKVACCILIASFCFLFMGRHIKSPKINATVSSVFIKRFLAFSFFSIATILFLNIAHNKHSEQEAKAQAEAEEKKAKESEIKLENALTTQTELETVTNERLIQNCRREILIRAKRGEPEYVEASFRFYTHQDGDGFNVWIPTCSGPRAVFVNEYEKHQGLIQKVISELEHGGLIVPVNTPQDAAPQPQTEKPDASPAWYQLTNEGIRKAVEILQSYRTSLACETSAKTSAEEIELTLIENDLLKIVCEGGVDVNGEYRFATTGLDGRLQLYVYDHQRQKYVGYVHRTGAGTHIDFKLVLERLHDREWVYQCESPKYKSDGDATWYALTSLGLEEARRHAYAELVAKEIKTLEVAPKPSPVDAMGIPSGAIQVVAPVSPSPTLVTDENSPAIPPNALPAAIQISPDSQAPPKEQEVETVPVPLGPAIPQETVPTPHAEPSA